jgi:hypothetical protein
MEITDNALKVEYILYNIHSVQMMCFFILKLRFRRHPFLKLGMM